MIKTDKATWFKHVQQADIGLTLGKRALFSKLQDLYRKRISKVEHQASHGFYVKNSTKISEANGRYITEANLQKYIGSNRKVWLFRYKNLTQKEKERMMIHANAAEVSGGTYAWTGILQFAVKFVFKKKKLKDKSGVFCTEHTSRIINAAKLAYLSLGRCEPWKVTPSIQLNWFLKEGEYYGWTLILYFDGDEYWVDVDALS